MTIPVTYIYNGNFIGTGNLIQIPREGDFFEVQSWNEILKVEAVMFKVLLDHSIGVTIYLKDIMSETETFLRNHKGV